jgi:hypothetical protein
MTGGCGSSRAFLIDRGDRGDRFDRGDRLDRGIEGMDWIGVSRGGWGKFCIFAL